MPKLNSQVQYNKRQITQHESTCGFNTGDPTQPRTAQSGYDCRFDTLNNLFGFCPTTVISATDCGLAGCCVDTFSCTSGCGILGNPSITTFNCHLPGQMYCSTALLTDSLDEIYSYIACGANAVPEKMFAVPTPQTQAVLSTSSPAAAAAVPTTSSTPVKTSASATNSLYSSTTTSITTSSKSAIGASNSLSGTTSSQNSGTSSFPLSSRPPDTGAIIGGVIGGLAIIAIFTLGIMFLRRYNKQPRGNGTPPSYSKRYSRWTRHSLTAMQTAGLHEKEGKIPTEYELEVGGAYKYPNAQGRNALFELGAS